MTSDEQRETMRKRLGQIGSWSVFGFPSLSEVEPDEPCLPVPEELAKARIKSGTESVRSPLGETLLVNEQTLRHLGKNGRTRSEFIARLREYDNARRTIENPHEIWMDVGSRRKKYIRMTRLEDGRRVVNAVDQQGHVYSWHVNDRHFDYYRTGRLLYLR